MKLNLVSLCLTTLLSLLGPTASAQTFSVIHTFQGSGIVGMDGTVPHAGVTLKGGALFGTAFSGGDGNGTVYEITQVGSNWITVPISIFSPFGSGPQARVIFGPDGHLYDTTSAHNFPGMVFELLPPLSACKTAACWWKEGELWQFGCCNDGAIDGVNPAFGDLIWDQKGNIYGTTESGGDFDTGTVYQLQPSGGNGWTETVIWNFEGQPDGANPLNGVMFDGNNNFYGTTPTGGLHNFGAVYKLTDLVGGGWTEQIIYDFQNGSDGANPTGGLIADPSGNLYGTTATGGNGGGTVFELSLSGDTWTFKLLYSFPTAQRNGCGPFASLAMDGTGNLYGTTLCCGTNGFGNVFKLSNTQNGWVYSSLYDFTGGSDGSYPYSNVTLDANGNLYGTASGAGDVSCYPPNGCGTVWIITP